LAANETKRQAMVLAQWEANLIRRLRNLRKGTSRGILGVVAFNPRQVALVTAEKGIEVLCNITKE
jgi:hypothetical protein